MVKNINYFQRKNGFRLLLLARWNEQNDGRKFSGLMAGSFSSPSPIAVAFEKQAEQLIGEASDWSSWDEQSCS